METLGQRIRATRIEYGMSQAELARRIGISSTALYQIETGKTPDPQVSRIKNIADVLGVSTDYLLGRDEDEAEVPLWRRRRRRPAKVGA
jgi:transcriptional regulator with XRE-family HTH domain